MSGWTVKWEWYCLESNRASPLTRPASNCRNTDQCIKGKNSLKSLAVTAGEFGSIADPSHPAAVWITVF